MLTIATRKAIDLGAAGKAHKRGRKERGESIFAVAERSGVVPGLAQVIAADPTPDVAAMVAETCDRLLEKLDATHSGPVAVAKMEGFTNREIAARLDCSLATVKRTLEQHSIRVGTEVLSERT